MAETYVDPFVDEAALSARPAPRVGRARGRARKNEEPVAETPVAETPAEVNPAPAAPDVANVLGEALTDLGATQLNELVERTFEAEEQDDVREMLETVGALTPQGQAATSMLTIAMLATEMDKAFGALRDEIVQLKARVEQLEQAKPAPRPGRAPMDGKHDEKLRSLPGYECCTGSKKLGSTEKCHQHSMGPNAQGLCPKAYSAIRALQCGLEGPALFKALGIKSE